DMLRRAGMAPSKIEVVYPGVDTARFSPDGDTQRLRQRLAPNGELILVTVGRLQRRKGHDLVLAALGLLKERLGPWRYVIVGEGVERASLEALAVEHGIADRVSFVGEVSGADLP